MLDIALSDAFGVPTCTSLQVADHFGKLHAHILRDIRELIASMPSEHESKIGFMYFEGVAETVIGNGAVRKDPIYYMTKNGFALLAMGFTGPKALGFKLDYISAFDAQAKALQLTQQTLQAVTQAAYMTARQHVSLLTLFAANKKDAEIELIVLKSPKAKVTCAALTDASAYYDKHYGESARSVLQQAVEHQHSLKGLLDSLPKPPRPGTTLKPKLHDNGDIDF